MSLVALSTLWTCEVVEVVASGVAKVVGRGVVVVVVVSRFDMVGGEGGTSMVRGVGGRYAPCSGMYCGTILLIECFRSVINCTKLSLLESAASTFFVCKTKNRI